MIFNHYQMHHFSFKVANKMIMNSLINIHLFLLEVLLTIKKKFLEIRCLVLSQVWVKECKYNR